MPYLQVALRVVISRERQLVVRLVNQSHIQFTECHPGALIHLTRNLAEGKKQPFRRGEGGAFLGGFPAESFFIFSEFLFNLCDPWFQLVRVKNGKHPISWKIFNKAVQLTVIVIQPRFLAREPYGILRLQGKSAHGSGPLQVPGVHNDFRCWKEDYLREGIS